MQLQSTLLQSKLDSQSDRRSWVSSIGEHAQQDKPNPQSDMAYLALDIGSRGIHPALVPNAAPTLLSSATKDPHEIRKVRHSMLNSQDDSFLRNAVGVRGQGPGPQVQGPGPRPSTGGKLQQGGRGQPLLNGATAASASDVSPSAAGAIQAMEARIMQRLGELTHEIHEIPQQWPGAVVTADNASPQRSEWSPSWWPHRV
eukprot:CAMPEP_0174734208 /NCGR_PEP_ID=MMETSP1094-20130205/62835_1 /TAXON_ID=156173 /ORGANISM="Chrysochromulina brevifilum, Strain UTEX LB 985" /LENGTH=199 /DNA_ID=CAMNT_0015936993 /DNA_START=51 /DNA_END=650 /DNA_ORIENTATION=+